MDNNKMMKKVKNVAMGAAVGAVAVAAGTAYVTENIHAHKAVNDAKRKGKKIVKAGEAYVKNIVE